MIRKLCTTLDVKIASSLSIRICQAFRPAIRHFQTNNLVPGGAYFLSATKDRFHRGSVKVMFWRIVLRSEIRTMRDRDVYADVFTATYILYSTLFIYLLIHNDTTVVNLITADRLDPLDRMCTWRFDDVECNVLRILTLWFSCVENRDSMH